MGLLSVLPALNLVAGKLLDYIPDPVQKARAAQEFQEKLLALGIDPMQLPPAEYGKLIADETDKWAKVVKTAGIKVE